MRYYEKRNGIVTSVFTTRLPVENLPANLHEDPNDIAECGMLVDENGVFSLRQESQAELALVELEKIDSETGMSRTMREALIAIAGPRKLAFLEAKEAAANIQRGKL